MTFIAKLVPLNLQSEREKFLADPEHYQPQFIYAREFTPEQLTVDGLPREPFLQAAREYLARAQFPARSTSFVPLTLAELEQRLTRLCENLGISKIPLVAVADQTSRFLLAESGELRVRWPVKISSEAYNQVLNHEIQTHFLRRYNNEKQPWATKRRPDRLWRRTEEGLAMYNSKDKDHPDVRSAAQLYLLVDLAQRGSFQDVYRAVRGDGGGPLKAWRLALRVKRGITDTSRPGGFTKDVVYWEGWRQVTTWLADPAHDWHDLYWGRVDTSEVETLRPQARVEDLVYPQFL